MSEHSQAERTLSNGRLPSAEGGRDGDNDGDKVNFAPKKVVEDKTVDVAEENGKERGRDGDNDGDAVDFASKKVAEDKAVDVSEENGKEGAGTATTMATQLTSRQRMSPKIMP